MSLILTLFSFLISFNCFASSLTFRAPPCVSSSTCSSHDFQLRDPADPNQPITLSFAVKNKNVDQLYSLVNEISNPKSARYAKYLSFEQIGQLTCDPEAKSLVLSHLTKVVDQVQVSSSEFTNFIRVKTDVKTAETLLNGKFYKFHSKKTGEEVTRMLDFELPDDLSQVLDYVSPTVQFPSLQRSTGSVVRKVDEGLFSRKKTKFMTPEKLNKYYNIQSNKVTNEGATQSLFASLGLSFSPKDLSTFQDLFNLTKDKVDEIIGPNNASACKDKAEKCGEPNLDVQWIMAVAQEAPTTFWSVEMEKGDLFLKWIEEVASDPTPPLVHSISYYAQEDHTHAQQLDRLSEEAAKLGARGVTILSSSGDFGAPGTAEPSKCDFHGITPTVVPYVLSVGGTMGPEAGEPEVACQSDKGSIITSGGGFSKYFERPEYQNSVVERYLSNQTVTNGPIFPPDTMFNSKGRAFPDVSMAANIFKVIIGGEEWLFDGTSCSTPVWAGILTLANDARLNKGKPPLGFVNPALYQLYESDPSLFNDILDGDNRCMISGVCCDHGFTCASGWDPVTGLGSPNVNKLIKALKKL